MSRSRTLRAWSAVHATHQAAVLLGGCAIASLVMPSAIVQQIGMLRLAQPLSILLLVPVVAGTGAAVATVRTFGLPVPDPLLARAARIAWALAWTAGAVAAVLMGLVAGADASVLATTRNVVVFTSFGLMAGRVAEGRYVWLPGAVYTLLAMLLGHPEDEPNHCWWAFALEPSVEPWHLPAAAGLLVAGLGVLAAPRRATSREPTAT